jgi:hypothetical protein
MLQLFLFLHVMGAIVTFGPGFAYPLITRHVQAAPQHAHFAAEVMHAISARITLPGAIVQGITGVALILILGADLTSSAWRWLIAGVVLYLIAIGYSILVQVPAAARMVQLTAGGPPPGPPPEGPPSGPPPEIAATARRLFLGGMFLSALIVLIVILMVTKPMV